jgi:hypothetical protein
MRVSYVSDRVFRERHKGVPVDVAAFSQNLFEDRLHVSEPGGPAFASGGGGQAILTFL